MMLYYVVVTYNIFFNYNMSHVIDEGRDNKLLLLFLYKIIHPPSYSYSYSSSFFFFSLLLSSSKSIFFFFSCSCCVIFTL